MLQWNFDQKIGEVEIFNYDRVITCNLYQGNAFLIMLYEYKEDGKDMYALHNFFADETHAKRCFGIDKRYKDSYGKNNFNQPTYKMQKIRLKKSVYGEQNTKKLVGMLIQAFDNLTIELYEDEDKENNE